MRCSRSPCRAPIRPKISGSSTPPCELAAATFPTTTLPIHAAFIELIDDNQAIAGMGGCASLGQSDGSQLSLVVQCPRKRTLIRLFRNGVVVASSYSGALNYVVARVGVYRVEAFAYRFRVGGLCLGARPWVFSNPIRVLQPQGLPAGRSPEVAEALTASVSSS